LKRKGLTPTRGKRMIKPTQGMNERDDIDNADKQSKKRH
jgi:hypothetical protein